MWPGNYSAYTVARELELQRQQQLYVDPAEGDRAARGGDPPLRGLGAPRRRRAPHQAGAQQAAADRPDGEGRASGARAAPDRTRAASARARRRARRRAARRVGRARRRRRSCRGRPRVLRGERVGVVGETAPARASCCGSSPASSSPTEGERVAGPSIRVRLPRAGPRPDDPRATPLDSCAARAADVRGRGRLAPDEVPVRLRAGEATAPRCRAASGRGCSSCC